MTLTTALEHLCEQLRSRTGASVALGRPREDAAGLYIFVWRVAEPPARRSNAPPAPVGPAAAFPPPSTHFFVFSTPSWSIEGLSSLGAVRQAILETTVLTTADGTFRLTIEVLPTDTLAAVFLAGQIPLTSCLTCVLEPVAPSGPG